MPLFFFFNDTATTEIYTLSLHDALPICRPRLRPGAGDPGATLVEHGTRSARARRRNPRARRIEPAPTANRHPRNAEINEAHHRRRGALAVLRPRLFQEGRRRRISSPGHDSPRRAAARPL